MRSTILSSALAIVLSYAGAARADDRAIVESLYTQLLSQPAAADFAARAERVLADDWLTSSNNAGGNRRADFVRTVQGFGQAVPDLKWEIQEILRDGNRYVVRGRATGTPVKPFLGVDPTGKSFDIMSIDIHTVENGRIVRSFHVEDWAGAIRQLRAP